MNQFDFLYNKEIKKNYKITEQKRLFKNRGRETGAEHKFDLSIKDRILMFMMYYRTYTTYDVLGMILDLDKSNVGRDIKYLEPAIK